VKKKDFIYRVIVNRGDKEEEICNDFCDQPSVADGVLIFNQLVDGRNYHYAYKRWDYVEVFPFTPE